jgi:hypothetical protein
LHGKGYAFRVKDPSDPNEPRPWPIPSRPLCSGDSGCA